MRTKLRGIRPSPALLVAIVAVVLAAGGTATAALTGKEKHKVTAIADREIAKQAPGLSVSNAARLGGVAASGYQRPCAGGAIKATVVVNTTGLADTFTNVPGFNCFEPGNLTSSVQIARFAIGGYAVRFVGNSGPEASGSAVVSELGDDGYASYETVNDPVEGKLFLVLVHNGAGNMVDARTFSLLAF
jgi:hypothetical protein